MDLPDAIQDLLRPEDFEAVQSWWQSLTGQQRRDCTDISVETVSTPIYDYLVNHELRIVGYVDESAQRSMFKIKSTYVAPLGEDYRHGQRGTVR